MTEPWTPGPWTVGSAWEVYGEASIWSTDSVMGKNCLAAAYSEANARLASLAPEMADLLDVYVKGDLGPVWLWEKTRDLLARARGEA